MPFGGVIIALDISGRATGVCAGCPGEKPRFETHRLFKEYDSYWEAGARGVKLISDLIHEPRTIGGELYGEGGAFKAGLVRVAWEGTVPHVPGRGSHATLIIGNATGGICGFAATKLGWDNVRPFDVSTVRAAFLGAGKGRLPSEQAKREVMRACQQMGWEPSNFDEADAGAVWWIACRTWAPELMPEGQLSLGVR